MSPEAAMRLALAQARRGLGRTFPNPAVGAVVVRGDRVLGRGFSRPAGGPHAEIVALERAARDHGAAALRAGVLAVTLEPCCHVGRTGPCTDAVLASGIRRVLVGHRDPNPAVAGGGIARLRAGGVRVEVGVLEAACREQHRGFLSRIERGRPYVTLKLAASLDGRIATAGGDARWVTGARARARVHALRAHSDAVAIGSRTALTDDPELTARRGDRVLHRPVRVLLDSRLVVPPRARLYRAPDPARTWVACADDVPARRRRAIEATGARLLAFRLRRGNLPLAAVLRRLAREGLGTLLVEGGGVLAAALWKERLVDELLWFVAPKLLGSDARPAFGELGVGRIARAPRLAVRRVRRIGEDWLVEAEPAGVATERGERGA